MEKLSKGHRIIYNYSNKCEVKHSLCYSLDLVKRNNSITFKSHCNCFNLLVRQLNEINYFVK